VVSAAWWGFDPADATAALQTAIDSGAHTVVVPRMARPWTVSRTIDLRRGGVELLLEPGVVLLAASGAFRETGEALIKSEGGKDFSILGYGATIRMRKRDYQSSPYKAGEWRHAINLRGVSNVRIAGLSIESSGGDGIYVGTRNHVPCEDVLLEDLDITDNHRQGISVISARRLAIRDCVISGTSGTSPGAGIDFEPNSGDPGFQDCLVSGCRIEGNAGGGILFVLRNLHAGNEPVSITVQDSDVRNFPVSLFLAGLDRGLSGSITIRDCSFGGIAWVKGSADFSVRFEKTR